MSSNISATLKSKRKELNLSVKEVLDKLHARGIDVSDKTLYGWESGHRQPDADTFLVLCNIYGISSLSGMKESPSLPDAALKFAKRYEDLDSFGKAAVLAVLEEEENRIEAQSKIDVLRPENESKVINLFLEPSAAGVALGMTGNSCEPYELKPNDPQGASYAVRLQGDSMAPYFPDGSIVFVNHDQMRDGDIGIFCVDGSTVCKQWHYDPVLNITYLFSLNRKREDADLVITGGSGRSLVWQGRVITKRRFPLPHER